MKSANVLILPGWHNSGPAHWQSRWEGLHGYQRVVQHDWIQPLRGDWMMQLEEAVLRMEPAQTAVLVAHSLGCILVSAWAQHSKNARRVSGALLVAPADPQQEALRAALKSWSPVVLQNLPFKSILCASQNDPYCNYSRAQELARAWGCEWVDCGHAGHINAESSLGDWPAGHTLLQTLTS